MLSPTFKVQELWINETFPIPISLPWEGPAPVAQNGASGNHQLTILFSKANPIPSVAKLKVKVHLSIYGIVSIDSITLMEEEEVEVPVVKETTKEPAKMETDEASVDDAPSTTSETDETDAKVEAPKKKVKKTSLPVTEIVYDALSAVDVQKANAKEFEIALQDRVMEETKDKKNVVLSPMFMT
ncbi:hypothetical protein RDI58_027004 [Solanum bulbocastanum]|uniref:Uncharacterized protein n=1 Tax=Solanum bulbocastanum TaxID=147425 RepID=A0AAN8T1G0_SOLBU